MRIDYIEYWIEIIVYYWDLWVTAKNYVNAPEMLLPQEIALLFLWNAIS